MFDVWFWQGFSSCLVKSFPNHFLQLRVLIILKFEKSGSCIISETIFAHCKLDKLIRKL